MVRIWLASGRVAGKGVDGERAQVRREDLVGVDGLGDGVGDGVAPEDLAEGDAHLGPQHPGMGGLRRDAVDLHDLAHQPVVDDLRVQGEEQRCRGRGSVMAVCRRW
jgi:hypothetical protein